MKIYELDFIPKTDIYKLGKYGGMSPEEFVAWFEQQKKEGRKVAKFFHNIYNKIVTDGIRSATPEVIDIYCKDTYICEADDDVMETKYFPVSIDKEAGLFSNLKRAFSEIGDELSSLIGKRRFEVPLIYPTAPKESFKLKLVADLLKEIYGNNKTIEETSADLNYVPEHIRNTHSKTIEALIAGNSICNYICLHPDLIAWSKLVGEKYVMHPEADLIDVAGSFDNQGLSILGLDSVPIGKTDISFIIPKGQKRIYSKVGDAVVSVLQDNLLPMSKEEIIEKVEHHHKMVKVEDYDENFIENVLTCDELIVSDKDLFWLKSEYLATDQQKMARLIFEEKKPISSTEAQEKFEKLYKHRMSSGLTILKKYGLRNIHGNIWSYHESELPPLQSFIDNYASTHKIFYFKDLEAALKAAGYILSASIRAYITNICQVDNNDKYHFCHKDFVDDYTEFSWRSQNRAGVTNWILNKIKDAMGAEDEMPVNKIYDYLKKEAKDTIFENRLRYRTQAVIDKYSGAGKPFLLKDNILHKNIASFDSFDFSIEGLKGGKYPFYLQIRAIVLNALKKSEKGRISLVDAIRLINESVDVPQDRNTVLRAITNSHLPKLSLDLQNIEGTIYIVRTKDEDASEPIYEIKTSTDPERAEIVPAAESVETRPDISYRLTLDWARLESAMKRELAFYKNWMNYEHIDFESAVVKFIDFIKSADNRNLSSKLPQYLYEYWFARTDLHDRETYVSQLAIFFEGLLSEIKFKKDSIRLHKGGLGDWMKEFGMAAVLTLPPHVAKGFDKIYKDLYFKRNRFAHGEMVEMSSTDTAKTISDYVAVYIYTIAKYA